MFREDLGNLIYGYEPQRTLPSLKLAGRLSKAEQLFGILRERRQDIIELEKGEIWHTQKEIR